MLALNLFESLTPVSVQILTSLGYDDSNRLSSQHFSQGSFYLHVHIYKQNLCRQRISNKTTKSDQEASPPRTMRIQD